MGNSQGPSEGRSTRVGYGSSGAYSEGTRILLGIERRSWRLVEKEREVGRKQDEGIWLERT